MKRKRYDNQHDKILRGLYSKNDTGNNKNYANVKKKNLIIFLN